MHQNTLQLFQGASLPPPCHVCVAHACMLSFLTNAASFYTVQIGWLVDVVLKVSGRSCGLSVSAIWPIRGGAPSTTTLSLAKVEWKRQ